MNKLYGLYAVILILTLTMAVISMGTPPQTAQPASAATQSQDPPAQSLPRGLLLGLGDLETEPCLITEEKLWAGKMLLIDSAHPLPEKAPAPNTLSVSALGAAARSPQTVSGEETIRAARQWLYAARVKGYFSPVVWAGTRSHEQQLDWQLDQVRYYAQTHSLQEAARLAAREREAPGCSEHQTGWALDIRLCESYYLPPDDQPLSASETGRYLLDTCWRYGFIHRYDHHPSPEEAWHFRYVGLPHAEMITALGLPFEKYLDFLHETGTVRYYSQGELKYVILCQPVQGDWQLRRPKGFVTLDASFDNQGWAVAVFGPKDTEI